MKNFLIALKRRNALLYWFGWFNLMVALICILIMPMETLQIQGVNRWLKPFKFYLSVGIMTWTMAWLMYHLSNARKVKIFSWFIFITMLLENGLILLQAMRKTTSHFNGATFFDLMVFQLMGIFIVIFTTTCIFIAAAFFKQQSFQITEAYLWGIRCGLILFITFSIEGGVMVAFLKHTVGGNDGADGFAFFNWSRKYGDLRIAHFFGLHALQLLPVAGWYVGKNKQQVLMISLAYFVLLLLFLAQALKGIPLLF